LKELTEEASTTLAGNLFHVLIILCLKKTPSQSFVVCICLLLTSICGPSVHANTMPPGHGKSQNLGRPFSRPGKSWKIAKVMESHEKVMENDDNVVEFLH